MQYHLRMRLSRGHITAGVLGLWNVAINRLLPERWYVPANLMMAAGVYGAARASGASTQALGSSAAGVVRGARWGMAGAALVGASVVAASRHETTRHLFADERAASANTLYETMVRIPLGTVIVEELAFRSVLPELLDGPGRRRVSFGSAALFGLWHILPTRNALDINGIEDRAIRCRAIAGGIAATTIAGGVLDAARLGSRSVVTPMLIHWSANAVSFTIAAGRASGNPPISPGVLRK